MGSTASTHGLAGVPKTPAHRAAIAVSVKKSWVARHAKSDAELLAELYTKVADLERKLGLK
jgi:hypothetical protein